MSVPRNLILAWMVAVALLAVGQNAFGQDAGVQAQTAPNQTSPDQTVQNQTTQAQTGTVAGTQDSGNAESGTVRNAPATALVGIAGMSSDSAEGQDMGLELPRIPSLLGGRGMSLAFPAEMERSNFLRGGVNVGAAYDDNPLLLSHPESTTSESVFGNIALEESTTRTRWTLGYAGGLTVNQKFTSQNQGSHNVNFDSLFRLSPHVNLRVAENFSMTTGAFDSGVGGQVAGGAGGPNASLITPLATQRSELTTVETNYHFALNDLVGASGSYYDLNFSNVAGQAALSNTQTATGAGFWLHKIFRGDWAGLSYRFQRITFDPDGETRVHSFLAVDTMNLGNGFSLSAFGGVQYADNQELVPGTETGTTSLSSSTKWSPEGGIEVGWRDARTSVLAGYSRSISDGGGVLGPVQLGNAYGSFRRELAPGWAVTAMANYGTNASILPGSAIVGSSFNLSSINLTSVGAGLERNVGKKLGLRLGYTHDFQQQTGIGDVARNRFIATLSYQWAKPLGM